MSLTHCQQVGQEGWKSGLVNSVAQIYLGEKALKTQIKPMGLCDGLCARTPHRTAPTSGLLWVKTCVTIALLWSVSPWVHQAAGVLWTQLPGGQHLTLQPISQEGAGLVGHTRSATQSQASELQRRPLL